jgi:hypothetical protein
MLRKFWDFVTSGPIKLLASVIVAVLGLYGAFGFERKPELILEVLANSSVLDVKEALSKLVVIYAGNNLKEQNQTLYLITVKISNSGNADIIKANFDDADPLGFRISTGTILEAPTIISEDYLKDNLKPVVRNQNIVVFAPVILNSGDSFYAKTLLLVKNGETPQITAVGKIAGIKAIRVSEPYREETDKSYFSQAFKAPWQIQMGRLAGYFLGTLVSLIVIIGSANMLYNFLEKQRRKVKIKEYRTSLGRNMTLQEEYIAKNYVEGNVIFDMFRLVAVGKISPLEISFTDEPLKELGSAGIILRDGPQVTLNPDVERQMKDFLSFITKAK